jgi:purine-nucleoside phosphorylase
MNRRPPSLDPSRAVRWIRREFSHTPAVGIVLGSGFGPVAEAIPDACSIPYSEIPGFPVGGVQGHSGRLILGSWHGVDVAVLAGRAHFYEGFDMAMVTFPTRVLAALGIRDLLLTNAAGGIRRGLKPGDFVAISDHINFLGNNPLRGPIAPGRERFIDMTSTYDPGLRKRMLRAAKDIGVRIREGVYLAVSGPSFETPAEIRAFRTLGADVVGMSTVPEAIVARQCGLRVAGLSCITNVAAGLAGPTQSLSHGEVLDVAREVAPRATRLVEAWLGG